MKVQAIIPLTLAVTLLLVSNVYGQAGRILVNPISQTVEEDVANVVISVIRLGGSTGSVSIDFTTVDGSAVAPGDYFARSGTLTWADGEVGVQTVTIGVVDDAAFELAETFSLTLSNPTGGAVLDTASSAEITIDTSDQDAGLLGFGAAAYSVNENGGTVDVFVTRTSGADGVVSVSYTTLDGTATSAGADADFTASSGVLTWANGDSSIKTISIAIIDDPDFELAETFRISLSDFQGGVAVGLSQTEVTILTSDQVAGQAAFQDAAETVGEDVGTFAVYVTRSGGSDGPVSVDYSAVDVTSTNGLDYVFTPGTLTWDSGDDTTKSIQFSIINDDVYEATTETFRILLQNEAGGISIDPSANEFVMSIAGPNDQNAGVISLFPLTYDVSEEDGSATVLLRRTGGADGPVSVSITTAPFEALEGSDYTATPQVVSWSNGDASVKGYPITLLDDDVFEPAEAFTVRISNPLGGASIFPTNDSATVTIRRSDQQGGVIAISQTIHAVTESVGVVEIRVTRTSPIADGAVSVRYATVDGSAVGSASFLTPGDFVHISGTLSWGNRDNATRSLFIIINDDAEFEELETFTFELTNVEGGATLGTHLATISIELNDLNPGYFAFAPSESPCPDAVCAPLIMESIGSYQLRIRRLGGFNSPVSVSYSYIGISASAPQDFVDNSGTVSWLNGDADDKIVTVDIVDDTIFEEAETFRVVLHSPTPASVPVGIHDNVTFTILPSDVAGGVLGFSSPVFEVFEEDGVAAITVLREGGDDRPATVRYTITPGSATDPEDLTAGPGGVLTWGDQDATSRTISVPLVDDDVFETNEQFTITLSDVTGDASLGVASISVVILESDRKAGILSFSAPQFVYEEDAGIFSLEVTRVNGSDGLVSVDYRALNGSARAGIDYELAPGSLVWTSGETGSKFIQGNIVDDTEFEPIDEAFVALLENPTGGAVFGPLTSTAVIIRGPNDFTAGTLGFADVSVNVNEETGSVALTILRTEGVDGLVTFTYASFPGTATEGIDYLPRNSTLVLPNGADSTTVVFTIVDDPEYERIETFSVQILAATGGASIDPARAMATVFILDDFDRNAGRAVLPCDVLAVSEADGTVRVSVERTGGKDGFVSVVAELVNGTARVGEDVASTHHNGPGSAIFHLNWTDASSDPAVFNISVIDDGIYEVPEVFYIRLRDPQGGLLVDDSQLVEVFIRGPNDVENEIPAALRSATADDSESDWEWAGPLALGIAALLLLLVCLFLALCLMYMRSSREPLPVAVHRHEVVVDPNQPAHKTEVLEVRHTHARHHNPASPPPPRYSEDLYDDEDIYDRDAGGEAYDDAYLDDQAELVDAYDDDFIDDRMYDDDDDEFVDDYIDDAGVIDAYSYPEY